jgi:hypothetical protein
VRPLFYTIENSWRNSFLLGGHGGISDTISIEFALSTPELGWGNALAKEHGVNVRSAMVISEVRPAW